MSSQPCNIAKYVANTSHQYDILVLIRHYIQYLIYLGSFSHLIFSFYIRCSRYIALAEHEGNHCRYTPPALYFTHPSPHPAPALCLPSRILASRTPNNHHALPRRKAPPVGAVCREATLRGRGLQRRNSAGATRLCKGSNASFIIEKKLAPIYSFGNPHNRNY